MKTHLALKFGKEQLQILNQHLEEKVTERTRELKDALQDLNRANAKLLELDRAKSEFLHIISHEIRTSLNGILGTAQLLKDQVDSNDVRELIEILDMSVARLEQFSLNALLITKLRIEKDKIPKQKISLKEVIDYGIIEVTELLKEKNIQTNIQKIPEKIFLMGDFDLLKTCFVKILENAIKYSDEQGQIELNVIRNDRSITCEVVDHGKGFSNNAMNKLFELFSSGEEFIDQNLGLGLALVKLIIDAHSGKIEIKNNEQRGASVKLIFNVY